MRARCCTKGLDAGHRPDDGGAAAALGVMEVLGRTYSMCCPTDGSSS